MENVREDKFHDFIQKRTNKTVADFIYQSVAASIFLLIIVVVEYLINPTDPIVEINKSGGLYYKQTLGILIEHFGRILFIPIVLYVVIIIFLMWKFNRKS